MDFLDSNAFEQMAREYNKKYSTKVVGVLNSNDDYLVSGTREVFCKVLILIANLEKAFKRYKQFGNFFEKVEIFKNDLKGFFIDNFNDDLVVNWKEDGKIINHKFCAISMLDTYINIFKLNIDILNEIEKLKNCLFLDKNVNGYSNINNNSNNNNGESLNSYSKQKLGYLFSKLYELQEIFKIFTENLKDFYTVIN